MADNSPIIHCLSGFWDALLLPNWCILYSVCSLSAGQVVIRFRKWPPMMSCHRRLPRDLVISILRDGMRDMRDLICERHCILVLIGLLEIIKVHMWLFQILGYLFSAVFLTWYWTRHTKMRLIDYYAVYIVRMTVTTSNGINLSSLKGNCSPSPTCDFI